MFVLIIIISLSFLTMWYEKKVTWWVGGDWKGFGPPNEPACWRLYQSQVHSAILRAEGTNILRQHEGWK